MKPVVLPIEDVIDLHTFRPQDIPDLIENYIANASAPGLLRYASSTAKAPASRKSACTTSWLATPGCKPLRTRPSRPAAGERPSSS